MSIIAKTPKEAFRAFQRHLNGVLNKNLTQYRVEQLTFGSKRRRAILTFLDRRRQPMAVPLQSVPWYLSVEHDVQVEPEGEGYVLRSLQYGFRIQRTALMNEDALIRFEYVSPALDPEFSYSRHHVQFHRAYENVLPGFSPNTLHIPTGGVTIEHVIRFLVTDLGVPPLTERWKEELRESEKVTRDWLSDAQQD